MPIFSLLTGVPDAWKTSIVCPHCQEIIDPGDKFCTFCGSPRSKSISPIRFAEVESVISDMKRVASRLNLFRIFWLFILAISVCYLLDLFPYFLTTSFFWTLPKNPYFLIAIAYGAAYSHKTPAFFYGSGLAYALLIPSGAFLMGSIDLNVLLWGIAFASLCLIGFIQSWKIVNYEKNYPELYESTF